MKTICKKNVFYTRVLCVLRPTIKHEKKDFFFFRFILYRINRIYIYIAYSTTVFSQFIDLLPEGCRRNIIRQNNIKLHNRLLLLLYNIYIYNDVFVLIRLLQFGGVFFFVPTYFIGHAEKYLRRFGYSQYSSKRFFVFKYPIIIGHDKQVGGVSSSPRLRVFRARNTHDVHVRIFIYYIVLGTRVVIVSNGYHRARFTFSLWYTTQVFDPFK